MENQVLNKLVALKEEWNSCQKKIDEIKIELEPVIIDRFKQLRYVESEVEERVKVAPRKYEKKTVVKGLVQWDEDFLDSDTGEVITITRSKVVKYGDEWLVDAFSLEELIDCSK